MTLLITLLIVYVAVCLILFAAQRSLIYFPVHEAHDVPAKTLYLKCAGEILKIWHIENNKEDAIIYFGGNAENTAYNAPFFKEHFPGFDVFLVNYRGYGGSTGSPTEKNLLQDAVKIYDDLSIRYKRTTIMGRSLGGSVAMHLASKRPAHKLVLVTPFDSIKSLARKAFPIFPVSLLLLDEYDSTSKASLINIPTLVVIAGRDEIVPRRNTDSLLSVLRPSIVTTKILKDETHNFRVDQTEYLKALSDFMNAPDKNKIY